MKLGVGFLAVAVLALAYTEAGNPGLRVRVTKKLTDGITKKVGELMKITLTKLPMLVEKIQKDVVPGKKEANFTFHDAEVTKNEIPDGEFEMVPENTVKFTLKGGDIQATVDMTIAALDNKRGKITGAVGDFDVTLAVPLETTEDGKLQLGDVECSMKMGKLEIDASAFGEMAAQQATMMAQMGKTMFENMACVQIKQGVVMANMKLKEHNMIYEMDAEDVEESDYLPGRKLPLGYQIHYDLVNPVKVTKDAVQLDFNGLFQKTVRDRSAINYQPEDMVDSGATSHQLHFLTVDEFFNQMLRELHHHNELYFDLPKKAAEKLLDSVAEHKDELGWDIQSGDKLEVKVSAVGDAPQVKTTEGKMTIVGTTRMDFKHTRGAEVLGEPSIEIVDESDWTVKILDQGDRIIPNMKEEMKFTKFEISKFENFNKELSDEKKALITEHLQGKTQKFINKFLSEKRYDQFMKKYGKEIDFFKVHNALFELAKSTMHLAFDMSLDVEKAWAFGEKMEKMKKGKEGGDE